MFLQRRFVALDLGSAICSSTAMSSVTPQYRWRFFFVVAFDTD